MSQKTKGAVLKEFSDEEFDDATRVLLHEDRALLQRLAKV